MIKTKIEYLAVEPPRRPAQIGAVHFNKFDVITQVNIEAIIDKVVKGDRPPLNHVCLPYAEYLGLATWMKAVENYVLSAEEYMDDVEDQHQVNQSKGPAAVK